MKVLGLEVANAGPLFLAALALHVLAGMTCVVAGALAATARKRPGRHPKAGHVYLWGIVAVFATASVMAVIRWREDWHLFVIATAAVGLAMFGWRARRSLRPGWPRWHATGMGGSYIALLTGFYVDNGPQLPLWNRLPHWTYWVIPAAVGIPLIWRALRRFAGGVSSRPPAAARSAAPSTPRR
jgi:hypothetical protein